MSNLKYLESFKIRASEIGFNQKATLPAICNLLQEAAGNHAQQLEFDIMDLQEDKLTWVLHRLCVNMERYPEWREIVTIETWPSSGDGLRAYRDFRILDSENNTIGSSLSYWLMMNIESRRPTPIPQEILDMAPKHADHVLPINKADYSDIKEADQSSAFTVRKTDLDLNRHVNNVRYIEWALSCLSESQTVNKLDIQFMSESVLGDKVIAEVEKGGSNTSENIHRVVRTSDQKIITKAFSR